MTGDRYAAVEDADWAGLARSTTGHLLRSGEEGFETARLAQIARFDDVVPTALACPDTEADVTAAVAFARRHGLELTVRSGGHSYAGFSSGRGLLLNLVGLSQVRLEGEVAVVGTGTTLGALRSALLPHGVMVPAGVGLTVGIGGSTLGGGMGIVGRRYGLTLDHLLAARVVLADGGVVSCDAEHDPELFWALRGAGAGGFGVVTEFRFSTRPATDVTAFWYSFPWSVAEAALAAWFDWIATLPDEVSCAFVYSDRGGESAPVAEVCGAMQAPATDAAGLLDGLVAAIGTPPVEALRRRMDWREATDFLGEAGRGRDRYRFTKSECFADALPAEGIEGLATAFVRDRVAGEVRGLEFTHCGGAYNRVPKAATAFWHRDQLFMLKYKVVVDVEATAEEKQAASRWLREVHALGTVYGSGTVYPNYPDAELADFLPAYYGGNAERLVSVKAAYDPDEVFRHPQSIPTKFR